MRIDKIIYFLLCLLFVYILLLTEYFLDFFVLPFVDLVGLFFVHAAPVVLSTSAIIIVFMVLLKLFK